jgi:hypothetical protein
MTRRQLLALAAATMTVARARAAPTVTARWDDFPPALQRRLRALGIEEWQAWAVAERADTRRRVDEGLGEHRVAVALQSRRWTTAAPIEPALSARAFIDQGRIPADAAARLDAFASVLASGDGRLGTLRALRPDGLGDAALRTRLRDDYGRTMRFLHAKEFEAKTADDVARLYQSRGLSTDTGVDGGYAVAEALGALPLDAPVRRLLIVGPGLDLGPRTGLDDDTLGQTVQPFAIADALRAAGKASSELEVDVLDVNPVVCDVVAALGRATGATSLVLRSSLSTRRHRLLPSYVAYLETWGGGLGVPRSPLDHGRDGRPVRGDG